MGFPIGLVLDETTAVWHHARTMPTAAPVQPFSSSDWIAIAAHRLSHRWPHVAPSQLDELAAELYRDDTLRCLPPADAAQRWLLPMTERPEPVEEPLARLRA